MFKEGVGLWGGTLAHVYLSVIQLLYREREREGLRKWVVRRRVEKERNG